MPESACRLDLGQLNHHAFDGRLYMASDSATGTALVPACFVLWSGSSKGIAIRLISATVSSTVAGLISFGIVAADPGFTAGNPSVNCRLGDRVAQAKTEAAAIAAPTLSGVLALVQGGVTSPIELLSPAVLYMPPNTGAVIFSTIAVQTLSVDWLWAELPPEDSND